MKIGIDLDEVLADLISQYILYLKSEKSIVLSIDRFTDYYKWDTWDKSESERIKLFEDFYKSRFFQNIKPVSGAHDVLKRFQKSHELYIITSRPKYLEIDTICWLEKNYPNILSGIQFASHTEKKKKSDICRSIGIDLMIEDSFQYALECAQSGINVLLIDYPWNKQEIQPWNIKKVKNWSEIEQLVH